MRGRAAFAKAQSGLEHVDIEAASEIPEVKVFGEWAYVWIKLSIVITPKKKVAPTRRAGNTLSILKKEAGAWVLFRDANMLAEILE